MSSLGSSPGLNTGTVLDRIVEARRAEVAHRRKSVPETVLRIAVKNADPVRDFAGALTRPQTNVIAEIKKASPSAGVLREDFDPASLARGYEAAGAAAISVLTEEAHFQGALAHLRDARKATSLPVLRKDFIVTEFQVREARAHGADAILLIAAAAPAPALRLLRQLARELGMAVLFEVHEEAELEAARACEPDLLGVNARDLRTLEVHPDAFARIAPLAQGIAPLVAESGVRTAEDVRRYRAQGASMLLVGEALSSAADPESAVRALVRT